MSEQPFEIYTKDGVSLGVEYYPWEMTDEEVQADLVEVHDYPLDIVVHRRYPSMSHI